MNVPVLSRLQRRKLIGLTSIAVLIGTTLLPFVMTFALWPRLLAALALTWWLPGILCVAHLRLPALDVPTAAALAAGVGWCWMVTDVLLIHWVPGPIELWQFIGAFAAGDLLLLVTLAYRWRSDAPQIEHTRTTNRAWMQLAALLLLATALRLPGLGYHEFHFDEVPVLTRAREAIRGADDAFARHTKGPGEIAVATVVFRALGTANETTARIPFGIASVGSVLALALLGRRLFSPAVGWWAGVLFAFNGFALGLSRIVQYQPAVLLLSALAVLGAWEFAHQGDRRWLALVGIFGAIGLIMHYEFALMPPALLMLVWAGWRQTSERRSFLRTATVVVLSATALVVAVYVPLLRHPYFDETRSYLSIRMGDLGTFNGPFFVEIGTFYLSSYFLIGLLVLLLAGLVVGWQRARRRTLLLTVWFLPFLILYLFIVRFPGTHFYRC